MQNYFKKYLIGCVLFFLFMTTIYSFNSFLNKFQFNLSAAVFNPTALPADAKPASGFAWNDNVGWINFGTTTSSEAGRVYISNNRLYGYAWGENIGWISLNCANTDANDCSTYGVTQNNGNGILTGYAWGENIGWINFNPTGGGVTLTTNTSGINTLSGDAWGENIGWVNFPEAEYGVTTTWNKVSTGGGDSVTTDSCVYDDPAWGPCLNREQSRTLNSSVVPCAEENPKIESRPCEMATSTATTTIVISINPAATSTFVVIC